MIAKDLHAQILRYHHVEHWPVGTIARHLHIHYSTVRRVLADAGVEEVLRTNRPSLSDPFIPFIVETLAKYPAIKASRVYGMVCERGYTGGPDHFRSVVRLHRPRPIPEAFLRLRTLPGEQAQVDWGHFGRLIIGRAVHVLAAFVMVLSFSRRRFLRFFLDQRMPSFLRGHVAGFHAFGGVPRVILYDNLKSAVLERMGDAIRFNPALLELASHYRFEPRPVAPARGNEKGRVERAIRDVREGFFVARQWKDLDDLNAQAAAWCEGPVAERRCPGDATLSVAEAFLQEQSLLIPLPAEPFPTDEVVPVSVGRTPYVRFDGNDYSVPHTLVRSKLSVVASPSLVRVLDGSEVVASHSRSYDKGQAVENPAHIAALVTEKAAARAHRGLDRLAHAAPNSRELLIRLAERGDNIGSATAALLRLLDTYGSVALEQAIAAALLAQAPHPNSVRLILERDLHAQGLPAPLPVHLPNDPRARNLVVRPHDLKSYDALAEQDP